MRNRIQSLIDDRTRMLAAMSHDFRTPLTRLRLRVEFFPESPERSKMLRDIADMEEMVDATLRFINDGVADEHREAVDFVSLLTDLSRSEEHTSELQSLMRTSYAVLCLKNKKKQTNRYT